MKRLIPARFGTFKNRKHVFKTCFKRVTIKRLKKSVNDYIVEVIKSKSGWLCVEEIANCYKIKHSQIDKYFRELNRLGVLSQKRREFMHDTNRNPIFYEDNTGWFPNIYYIQITDIKELDEIFKDNE